LQKSLPWLSAIESSLREMVSTVSKMYTLNVDAEEAHFSAEEAMTMVVAQDDQADELIASIMAGERCGVDCGLHVCLH
jgi:hypothetical protein